MAEIFLSYCPTDLSFARRVAQELAAVGHFVAWDQATELAPTWDAIKRIKLDEANTVVVLWSKSSVNFLPVYREANRANRNKTLVPVIIEDCERPRFPALTRAVDLSHWEGAPDDPSWRAVLQQITNLTDKPTATKTEPNRMSAPRSASDDGPSLAIIPFANLSDLAEDDAWALGMVDDIILVLSSSPDLHVFASSATSRFAADAFEIGAVARELGARYLLEGNILREGNALRVTVQLVEADTDDPVWTERFERPILELADLQRDLLTGLARHFGVELQYAEFDRALAKPGEISAYLSVQRATAAFGRLDRGSVRTAVTHARLAVDSDPDYALARSVLAFSLAVQSTWTFDDDDKIDALKEVKKALDLAPDNPLVLARCARALTYLDRAGEALRHAQTAIDRKPNLAAAVQALGAAYLCLGRNEEAIGCFDAEERLAPDNYAMYVSYGRRAQAHVQAGKLEQAYDAMTRSFEFNDAYPQSFVLRAGLCFLLKKYKEAGLAIRQLRELERDMAPERHVERYLARVHKPSSRRLMVAFIKAWRAEPASQL